MRVLTDPLLRQRIGHLRRQTARVRASDIGRIDAALISHAHHDHFDPASLRQLGRETVMVVAAGIGSAVSKLGFRRVVELSAGESTELDGARVTATEALHDGKRGPFGSGMDAVGYLIERDRTTVYFAGDTDLFDGMSQMPGLDLALLPVWGWGPRLGLGHLNPKRAVEALTRLRPRTAIPIHWGTLYPIGLKGFRSHLLHEPPRAFARHAAALAPDVDVRVLEPGSATTLEDR